MVVRGAARGDVPNTAPSVAGLQQPAPPSVYKAQRTSEIYVATGACPDINTASTWMWSSHVRCSRMYEYRQPQSEWKPHPCRGCKYVTQTAAQPVPFSHRYVRVQQQCNSKLHICGQHSSTGTILHVDILPGSESYVRQQARRRAGGQQRKRPELNLAPVLSPLSIELVRTKTTASAWV